LRGAAGGDAELLATYDEALVASGTGLILARRRYLAELGDMAASVMASWVRNERLEVRYAPSVPFDVPTEDAVRAAFVGRLAELRAGEAARRTSLVGPHRDDVLFLLDGEPLAAFGSQGQQRTAVLALKVAEYTVLRERSGEAPLLLLDDVLSELDVDRAQHFIEALAGIEQAFITATARPPAIGTPSAAWEIAGATLQPC